jgi:hypothetical protein
MEVLKTAKIGDEVSRVQFMIDEKIYKLNSAVTFIRNYIDEFNTLGIKGPITEFIQKLESRNNYYRYIEQAGENAVQQCKGSDIELPALVSVVKERAVKDVTEFIEKVRVDLARQSFDVISTLSDIEIKGNKVSIKENSIDRINRENSVILENEAQVKWWNLYLLARDTIEQMNEMIQRNKPDQLYITAGHVLEIHPMLYDGLKCKNPNVIKFIK